MVLRVFTIILLIWGIAFTLACRLLSMPENQNIVRGGLTAKMFGVTRDEISGQFYTRADRVFHKGFGYSQPAVVPDWFARMRREVTPSGHMHLHKEGVLEIMPWLYFAVRADPGNVTAYAVAAYWLAGEAGRPDLAEGVLNEALRNNPSDYRIYMEKGILALKEGKYGKAARWLDAAISLYQTAISEDQEQMRINLAEILTYRGLLYELQGRLENALRCYREVTDMFPGRLNLKERMIELEKSGRAPTPPENLARILLFQHRHVCVEEEDG